MSIRVALIDDDLAVLDSLRQYFFSKGILVNCYTDAPSLIAALDRAEPFDCIVADVRLPEVSGIELLSQLAARERKVPTILITGHGDIEMAVAAIKLGAFDFIEKPFDEERLLVSIHNAIDTFENAREDSPELAQLRKRFDSLSLRQRQVMELAAAGLPNKEIARRLNISAKTVENHRAWVMERMGASNLAELIRMAMRLN